MIGVCACSTMSSALSSMSAMTVEDYIKPYYKEMSDTKLTAIAKLSVPIYGVIAIGISFMIAEIAGPMSQISASLLSSLAGPTAGLCLYSVFFPWATKKGAMVGTIMSVILSFWLALGKSFSKSLKKTPWATMPPIDNCYNFSSPWQNDTKTNYTIFMKTESLFGSEPQGLDRYYSLSYQWIGVLGMIYFMVIAVLTSLIEGLPKTKDIDVRYILPYFDQFFPCLPAKLRKKLYLGVRFDKREELLKNIDLGSRNYETEIPHPKPFTTVTEELLPKENIVLNEVYNKHKKAYSSNEKNHN